MFILMALGAALVIAPVSDAKNKTRAKPRKSDGSYTLTVAGFYSGAGRAVVSGGGVRLTLSVVPESGGKSAAIDFTMPVNGNRFTGDSTLAGNAVHFDGRLDAPDDEKERTIRGVRLVCRMRVNTLTAAGMAYSSVVGFVPELAFARDAIDEGEDNNKGKKD
jgi:hypothetical protein